MRSTVKTGNASQCAQPFRYKRDYVIQLTDAHPHLGNRIMRDLKVMTDHYNRQQRTIFDFFRESEKIGLDNAAADRKA